MVGVSLASLLGHTASFPALVSQCLNADRRSLLSTYYWMSPHYSSTYNIGHEKGDANGHTALSQATFSRADIF